MTGWRHIVRLACTGVIWTVSTEFLYDESGYLSGINEFPYFPEFLELWGEPMPSSSNVDFNMFLFNGEPELEGDIVSLLVSLRLCGNFGDACVEIGGGGHEYDFLSQIEYVNDPDYSEHVSFSREKLSDGLYPARYEFNRDGCPSKISYDVIYDVFTIEYDKVADTSESFPFNPYEGPKPEEGEGGDQVWYRVTTKNYTETKTGEIKCPAVYTITYKE